MAARISQTLAIQLRVLRQRAGLSQPELARDLGTSQNAISRMESPVYGRQSISTLKKVAQYFDVGLVVRFAPFSEIMDWTLNFKEESVAVPDFAHDRIAGECCHASADESIRPAPGRAAAQAYVMAQSIDANMPALWAGRTPMPAQAHQIRNRFFSVDGSALASLAAVGPERRTGA